MSKYRQIYISESARDRFRRHIEAAILSGIMRTHKSGLPPNSNQINFEEISRLASENLLRDYRLVRRERS